VVTGFEALDILEGIRMALDQIVLGSFAVEKQGAGSTRPEPGTPDDGLADEVFMRAPAEWRGLGVIPGSALVLRNRYATFNALARFDVPILDSSDIMGCMCGSILRGVATPRECPLFGHACNPENPIGPCMVSHEGACSTEYAVS
jgi:hydrogenase expression/formation protein HypD